MQIFVNGASHSIDTPLSLAELLLQLNVHEKRVAIELNQAIISRGQHAETFLQEGDVVEIIQAIAGG